MTLKGKAYIAGAYEHPTRHAPDKSTALLHAESALGALADAGLSLSDVDGYFCAADAPGANPLWMADYLNLRLRWLDGTDAGGCSYLTHVAHATAAIAAGHCDVALVTLAGRPRSEGVSIGVNPRAAAPDRPDEPWETAFRPNIAGVYGLFARRHMLQYGTTAEQMAWVKVSASRHAQHNANAFLPKVVTVEDVLNSPVIADGIHRLDCCVITDGGGALVLVKPEIARSLSRPLVRVIGTGETVWTQDGGYGDITRTGAEVSGPAAFAEAGVTPADIQYASIYDNFTIMVLMQLEGLGFCAPGAAGRFAAEGNLIAGSGRLPWNTDGGGLCNNHPANRGGMTKVIEAVRQLRGEAHPAVQVPGCGLALACGPGRVLGSGHGHATVILERE
ncbi:acetyl-CoA C-acetyltransferase [Stella humosa]|uniref:Acetyl-CoA C-acetyltransferase n=1 Tax=Stella humosa TaxID=94 RepID=A0A3N1KV42_9PROT|nr:thiolase domain-containing protein [Stella humosa]ROP81205.1 acetyl-CoA C-acetyltransferase [Stella humosa]BBK32552.1 acetyl-CoA acetyltransferase [Stella humosa]